MKLGKQLAEKAREIAQEKEEAEGKINEIGELSQMCQRLGFSSPAFEAGSKNARDRFDAKDYRSCVAEATRVIALLHEELQKLFFSRIESTQHIFDFIRSRSADAVEIGGAIGQVRALVADMEYERANNMISELWSKQERSLSELYASEFSKVQRTLVEARSHGLAIEGVDGLLSSARNEMNAGGYESAFRLLDEAGKSIVLQFRRDVDSQIKEITGRIEICRMFGLGISSIRERLDSIQSMPAEAKFGEIESLLLSLKRDVDQRLRRAFEVNIKTIRNELGTGQLNENVSASASLRLKEIEELTSSGEFEKAYSLLKSFEGDLEKAKYDFIARILYNSKKYIADAFKNGADLTAINARMNEVRELVKRRRFEEAVRMAERANEEARELFEKVNRASALYSKMEGEYAVLTNIISNSVDISIRYADARRKFEEKKFDEFIAESTSLIESMHGMLETFSTSQVDALDRKISALEYLGAETLELNERLENAISLVRNSEYNRCLEITGKMDRDIDEMLMKLNGSWIERASAATEKAEGSMKERFTKLLREASELRSGQNYFRSACTAKDIVDWATNGNVFRAQSLIQRTRRLLSIFPDIKSSSASSMLENAERMLSIDVESSLKSAGEAHDIVYGLITNRFVKVMSELMNMVSTSRRKKIEIGYGYNLIGRARAALKFEDFETAGRMASLAKDEIEGKLRSVEEIEQNMEKAEKLSIESRKLNIPIEGLDEKLEAARSALKRFDYQSAGRVIGEALEMEDRGLASYLAPKEVLSVKSLLQLMQSLSLDSSDFEGRRSEITAMMRERRHYDALILARKTLQDIEAVLQNALDSAIRSVEAESSRAEVEGIDVKPVESRLERARELLSKRQYEQAYSSVSLADKELNFSRNAVAEASAAIEGATRFVEKLDELGIIDSTAVGMLKQARTLLSNEQHLLSLQTSQKCTELCVEALRKKGERILQECSDSMIPLLADDAAASILQRIESLRAAIAEGKPEAADELLYLKELNDKLRLQKEMAERTLDVTVAKIRSAGEQGVDTAPLKEEAEYMRSLLSGRRYGEVIERGLRVEQAVDDMLSEARRLSERVDAFEKRINGYAELGIPMDGYREKIGAARELISSGKVQEGRSLLSEAEKGTEEMLNKLCISTINALEGATKAADELGIEFRPGLVEQAREYAVAGKAAESLSISYPALKDVSFMLLETLQAAFNRAVQGIDYPENLKKDALTRIESLVSKQMYDDAVVYLREVRENAARKAEIFRALEPIRNETSSLSREFRNAGINIRGMEMRLNSIFSELPDSSVTQAQQILEEMKRLKKSLLPAIKVDVSSQNGMPALRIMNSGKAVALNVTSSIRGKTFNMNESLGNLKPGEARVLSISPGSSGEISVEIKSGSPLGDGEHTFTAHFRMEGGRLSPIHICAYCRGKIKDGVGVYSCECGREYHIPCSERVERCECGRTVESGLGRHT